MSQGQSKEGEHLISTCSSGQSSVHSHRAVMPVSSPPCHTFFSFSLGSESNPFEISRALSVDFKDQALWRKCRSGSTNLSFISFCFPFPLLSLISERNMPYSVCSQTVLGREPPQPGTVSLGCQNRKEHSCSSLLLAPLASASFHQSFFSFLMIWCNRRKYLAS